MKKQVEVQKKNKKLKEQRREQKKLQTIRLYQANKQTNKREQVDALSMNRNEKGQTHFCHCVINPFCS